RVRLLCTRAQPRSPSLRRRLRSRPPLYQPTFGPRSPLLSRLQAPPEPVPIRRSSFRPPQMQAPLRSPRLWLRLWCGPPLYQPTVGPRTPVLTWLQTPPEPVPRSSFSTRPPQMQAPLRSPRLWLRLWCGPALYQPTVRPRTPLLTSLQTPPSPPPIPP